MRRPGFDAEVYEVVLRIPRGRVATYGDVAAVLGNRHLARQVGWALGRLSPIKAEHVPWQRVINAQGRISHRGEVQRADEQARLLEAEGVVFDARGRCDLETYRCHAFELDPGLDGGL